MKEFIVLNPRFLVLNENFIIFTHLPPQRFRGGVGVRVDGVPMLVDLAHSNRCFRRIWRAKIQDRTRFVVCLFRRQAPCVKPKSALHTKSDTSSNNDEFHTFLFRCHVAILFYLHRRHGVVGALEDVPRISKRMTIFDRKPSFFRGN